MTLNNPLYSEISPRVESWLQFAQVESGDIPNRTLDTINRAQDFLQMQEPWEELWSDKYTLTLTSNAVALPSDFYRPIWIFDDVNGLDIKILPGT